MGIGTRTPREKDEGKDGNNGSGESPWRYTKKMTGGVVTDSHSIWFELNIPPKVDLDSTPLS